MVRTMGRWGAEQNKKLAQLFDSGDADPSDTTPEHIKNVWEANSWLQDIYEKPKNFYSQYRAKAADYETAEALKGACSKCCAIPVIPAFIVF